MEKTNPPEEILRTDFITAEQVSMLTSILDLSLDEVDGVTGGACSCVNCCSHHKPAAK